MTLSKNTIESNEDLELFWCKEDVKQRMELAINQTYVCGMAAADSGFKDVEGALLLLGELLTKINSSIEPQPTKINPESSIEAT